MTCPAAALGRTVWNQVVVSFNRVVMQRSGRRIPGRRHPAIIAAAERVGLFGNPSGFNSHTPFSYPTCDKCAGPFAAPATCASRQFDQNLADQTPEKLDRPYAARHVQPMLRSGGYFWIAVRVIIPLHSALNDNSRWSAREPKNPIIKDVFDEGCTNAQQWGNCSATACHLEPGWPPKFNMNTHDLTNCPQTPLCTWALT